MAAKLGGDVAMISKLGNDAIGDNYMENYADLSMNTDNVGRTDAASTGAATIIVDGDVNKGQELGIS